MQATPALSSTITLRAVSTARRQRCRCLRRQCVDASGRLPDLQLLRRTANRAAMTTTRTIDGKACAERVRAEVTAAVAVHIAAGRRAPGLATILVGEDPASHVYVKNKRKQAAECGLVSSHHALAATTTTAELLAVVQALNNDPNVDGILVQLPLPRQVDENAVLVAVDPHKDVDGFHPENVARLTMGLPGGFVPCTPLGCRRLLEDEARLGTLVLQGARAVVVGRSNIVGKPMASLLLERNCTVTIAHSKTRDLQRMCSEADILVAAIGRAQMIGAGFIKEGAVVIDVGINRVPGVDGAKPTLVGDVDWQALQGVAAAATPVPGGVGPMTIAMLLQNTLTSYVRRQGLPL